LALLFAFELFLLVLGPEMYYDYWEEKSGKGRRPKTKKKTAED